MKAIAIRPGVPGSLHLRDVPRPSLDDVPGGRGVRVGIVRAGLCGTDAELAAGAYGRAPEGSDFLVLGHESLGRVREVGPAVTGEVSVGQLVVVTIRRPGGSPYDRIGRADLSTDDVFIETGISRAHGFLTEEVVADACDLAPVPDELEPLAILTEPLSCITKSLRQADQVQGRLELWEPRRALVTGAGTIGLLATLVLRLRGLEVTTFGRRAGPYRNSELLGRLGARYISAADTDLGARGSAAGCLRHRLRGLRLSRARRAGRRGARAERRAGALQRHARQQPHERGHGTPEPGRGPLQPRHRGQRRSFPGDYAAAVATIGDAEADPATRGWLAQLITDRIRGLDADAIAGHLAGRREGIKTTIELGDAWS